MRRHNVVGLRIQACTRRGLAHCQVTTYRWRVHHVPGQRTKRVLVVDDSDDTAEMLAELLRLHGHDVAVARGGLEALALVPQFTPEVALLDIALPDMDGCELARRLRSCVPSCRLLALTGFAGAEVQARTVEAGFAVHLVKPVSIADVLAALE